jgi:hypothetical protein
MPLSHDQSASSYTCQEYLGVLNSLNTGHMIDRPTMFCLYPGLTSPHSHGSQLVSMPVRLSPPGFVPPASANSEAYKGRPRRATCSLHLHFLLLRRRRVVVLLSVAWSVSFSFSFSYSYSLHPRLSIIDGGGALTHKRRFVALRCS